MTGRNRGIRRLSAGIAAATLLVLVPATSSGADRSVGEIGGMRDAADPADELDSLLEQLASLGGTREDWAATVRSCRAAGFSEAELRRALRIIVRAKLAGIPASAVANKLREGLAKNAGPDSIQEAMERRAQTLRRAKALTDVLLVDGWIPLDYGLSVELVADALDAGLGSDDVLRCVRESAPVPPGIPNVRAAFRKAQVNR